MVRRFLHFIDRPLGSFLSEVSYAGEPKKWLLHPLSPFRQQYAGYLYSNQNDKLSFCMGEGAFLRLNDGLTTHTHPFFQMYAQLDRRISANWNLIFPLEP